MSGTAIQAEGLSKAYCIGLKDQIHDSLGSAVMGWLTAPVRSYQRLRRLNTFREGLDGEDLIWAVRDVSLTVGHGEVVGVIGRNGAGKSTLLKILSRITCPTRGRAVLHGRVGSLLEVGTGFHPELSGRDNVYLNGTILGMAKRDIDARFDEIVAFSGVERFIDTPIKRYSSGMRVRLAFSVAAHLEPEILVIDEVLAVGDQEFQRRCMGKMGGAAQAGRTVLFVSHNLAAVAALCRRTILMERGRVVKDGETEEVLQLYREAGAKSQSLGERTDRQGNGVIRFVEVEARGATNRVISVLSSGQDVRLALRYIGQPGGRLANVDVAVMVRGAMGELMFYCSAQVAQGGFASLPREGAVVCRIPALPLMPGSYSVDLWCRVGTAIADEIEGAATLQVVGGDFYGTGRLPANKYHSVLVDNEWAVEG